MNSLTSACSFAKSTPVSLHQLEKDVEPFLGRQVSVKLIVSRLGIFKAAEHLNDSFHGLPLLLVHQYVTVGDSAITGHLLVNTRVGK